MREAFLRRFPQFARRPLKIGITLPEIRNPNAGAGAGNGSQDNRSFLLMMFVMLGVLLGLQFWRARHNPQTAAPDAPAAVAAPATPNPGVGNTLASANSGSA